MKHQVRVTVLDTKLYPELQEQYCMDPKAGRCPIALRHGMPFPDIFMRDCREGIL